MTPPPPSSVSVVVPTYANASGLESLVQNIAEILRAAGRSFEILLVNDGSPDATWPAIQAAQQGCPEVRGINLMRNYGQHNALLAGILHSRKDIVVTIDDDFQTPPSEIGTLLAKLEEGYDLVYGTREREQHGWARNLASQGAKWVLQNMMNVPSATAISSFRAFRRSLMGSYSQQAPPEVFLDALLAWNAQRIASITVRHCPRPRGRSNYSWPKLAAHGINMVTGFSVAPLRLAVWLGFLVTAIGVGLFCFVIGSYFLIGSRAPGFTFLAAVILLFSGAQLCAIGIIGEYLARVYLHLLGKPAFVIKEIS